VATGSIAYYCDRLGFSTSWTHGDEKLIIAQVGRGGFDLILDSDSVLPRPANPSVVTFSLHKPHGLGDLHREFVRRGADVLCEPFPVIWQSLDERTFPGTTFAPKQLDSGGSSSHITYRL
jgi:hypothetical protein